MNQLAFHYEKPSGIPLVKLSSREKQILFLISMEKTNDQIAGDLFLSKETIHSHRKHIMEKLNAANTAGMIRRAYEPGILKIPAAIEF